MKLVKSGITLIKGLLIMASLAVAFMLGLISAFYLSLTGEEIKIPKIVGKNYNEGRDELIAQGLRIKKIASRYSEEIPNTILEQRPQAGTTAKTGLMISVVVSKENPDATEAPAAVKEEEDNVDEIKELPELRTEKPGKKKQKKVSLKTRDVIENSPKSGAKDFEIRSRNGSKNTKKFDRAKKAFSEAGDKKANKNNKAIPKSVNPKSGANDKKTLDKKKPRVIENGRPRYAKESN